MRSSAPPARALIPLDNTALFMTGTAKASCRLPSGHPEAFLEAFANIYLEAFRAIAAEVVVR